MTVPPEIKRLRDESERARLWTAADGERLLGHPLSGDNLYVYPDGVKRECRQCRTERHNPHRERFLTSEGEDDG